MEDTSAIFDDQCECDEEQNNHVLAKEQHFGNPELGDEIEASEELQSQEK